MSSLSDIIIRLRDGATASGSALMIIAGVVLVIVVLVVAAMYIARLLSPRGSIEQLIESRTSSAGNANPWPTRLIVAAVALVSIVGVHTYAAAPSTCVGCHKEAKFATSLHASAHAGVACGSCHGSTGAASPLTDSATYAGWGWAYYVNGQRPKAGARATVDSAACLACHGSVLTTTQVVGGIRVRHKDFVDAGSHCVDCHGGVAHDVTDKADTTPTMASCLPCHDGKTASSDCVTCHTGDPTSRSLATRKRNLAVVFISDTWDSCYRCHSPKPCTTCHGVVMPHPPGWGPATNANISGGGVQPGSGIPAGAHAKQGFADRASCWRCHHAPGQLFKPADSGCSCHGLLGSMHGGTAWIKEHGLEATGAKTGIAADCADCHGDPNAFCGLCHPSSFAARYSPTVGPDHYTRLQPQTPSDRADFGKQ